MSTQQKISTYFISGILLFLVGFIVLNQGFFVHTHQLVDGTLITHAHPYNKTSEDGKAPASKHQHSTAQYLLIEQFNMSSVFIFLIFSLTLTIAIKHIRKIQRTDNLILIDLINHSSGRSPPFN